jgi:long-chain fatty acid transport protein
MLTPRLIPALIALAFSGSAVASGFQLIEQNASGIGNAYAGSAAVADNASTIFFNPAGMTQLQAREFSLGMSVVKPSFKFNNEGSSVPNVGSASLAGNGNDGGTLAYIPNGYFSMALNKDLYFGIGLSGPFGLMTEYDSTWLGAAQSISFEIKTYNINPSIAYRVNDKVSIGFGLNWMRMEAEYVKRYASTTNPPGIVPATALNPLATLTADDDSWGWNVGALFNVSPSTKVGVSYRSTVKQTLDGTLTVAGVTSFGAKADIELPDTLIISAAQKLNDKWEMLGDLSWTGWSSVPKVDIIRKADGAVVQRLDTAFKDSWRIAFGANYQINDAWKLKFGVAYDNTPVPDASHRLVSLPDNDRTWLSLGAQWKPSKEAALDLGAAYLFVKDTDINAVSASTGTTVKGNYDSNVWILGAQYSRSF